MRVTAALKTGEVAPEDVPPSGRKPDEGEEKPKKARKATKKKADDDEGEEEPKKTKAGSSKVYSISFNEVVVYSSTIIQESCCRRRGRE